jgi:hypothetical protein
MDKLAASSNLLHRDRSSFSLIISRLLRQGRTTKSRLQFSSTRRRLLLALADEVID